MLIQSCVLLYVAMQCVESSILWCNVLKTLIIASHCFLSRQLWGPINLCFGYDYGLRREARSGREGKTFLSAGVFSQR